LIASIPKGYEPGFSNRCPAVNTFKEAFSRVRKRPQPPLTKLPLDLDLFSSNSSSHDVPRRQDPKKRENVKGAFIHSDLAGGGKIKRTLRGHAYAESFVDDATDMTFATMLKRKSDAPVATKDQLNKLSTQGTPVKRFSTDNEIIYAGYKVQNYLKEHGIQWEPSTPYNPSQNPVAERTFRTLFERIRSVLNDAELPQYLWGEALNFVVYCKNRSPTKALNGMTPYEAWYGSKPQLGHMHAFGCVAYMYDNDPALRKLDNKSKKCRFIGYEGSNQYRLWDPKKRQVYRASWVRFDDIVSNEMGASTDESWDFFSEDTDSNMVPVRLTGEDDLTGAEPLPQPES